MSVSLASAFLLVFISSNRRSNRLIMYDPPREASAQRSMAGTQFKASAGYRCGDKTGAANFAYGTLKDSINLKNHLHRCVFDRSFIAA